MAWLKNTRWRKNSVATPREVEFVAYLGKTVPGNGATVNISRPVRFTINFKGGNSAVAVFDPATAGERSDIRIIQAEMTALP